MSVYKEGFKLMEQINKQSVRIYPDACDFGAPTKKGDKIWNAAKQLAEWYGELDTRKEHRYLSGRSVTVDVTLLDEAKYSYGGVTEKDVTVNLHLEFVSCVDGMCKGYDGYVFVLKK